MQILKAFLTGVVSRLPLPLYAARVAAGFPSPADDYIEGKLDLNEHLVKRPAATFFVRVEGDSMIGAGGRGTKCGRNAESHRRVIRRTQELAAIVNCQFGRGEQ